MPASFDGREANPNPNPNHPTHPLGRTLATKGHYVKCLMSLRLVQAATRYRCCHTRRTTTTTRAMSPVVDSHLHVWAGKEETASFPYEPGREPPESLAASTDHLLKTMDLCKVDKAMIVQPINHLYDHRYVSAALRSHLQRLRGMLLANPTATPEEAVLELKRLVSDEGFSGVRFNPYLWPVNEEGLGTMNDEVGRALFDACGTLSLPVGFMFFQGILHRLGGEPAPTHADDAVALMESFPDTKVIFDHFGFTNKFESPEAWRRLLQICDAFPQVYVKVSAPFRVSKNGYPYDDIFAQQLNELLRVVGAERLMIGSDFPFVQEQEGGYASHISRELLAKVNGITESDVNAIMGGTADKLFFKV